MRATRSTCVWGRAEAKVGQAAAFHCVETFYNPRRRHSALAYRSPAAFEKMVPPRKEVAAVA